MPDSERRAYGKLKRNTTKLKNMKSRVQPEILEGALVNGHETQ